LSNIEGGDDFALRAEIGECDTYHRSSFFRPPHKNNQTSIFLMGKFQKSSKSTSEHFSKINIFTLDKYLHVTLVITSICEGLFKYKFSPVAYLIKKNISDFFAKPTHPTLSIKKNSSKNL